MSNTKKIAVCSRSFSKSEFLKSELNKLYKNTKYNNSGKLLSGQSLIDFIGDSTHIIVALEKIDEEIIKKCKKLEVISKYGVGVDKIDFRLLEKNNIRFGWTPGVNANNVAEHTLLLMLNLLKNYKTCLQNIKNNKWEQVKGRELGSMCIGIIGYGHVGKAVAKKLKSFDCKILINDIDDFKKECANQDNLSQVCIEELLEKSDIVTLHIPYNKDNHHFFDKSKFTNMKRGSYLINAARGGIVDEKELLINLNSNYLSGAGLDVLEEEPQISKLISEHEKIILTPHIGGSSYESIKNMGLAAINGLENNFEAKKFFN